MNRKLPPWFSPVITSRMHIIPKKIVVIPAVTIRGALLRPIINDTMLIKIIAAQINASVYTSFLIFPTVKAIRMIEPKMRIQFMST
jgi:hypothetical protein